jgi:hypothetical protein
VSGSHTGIEWIAKLRAWIPETGTCKSTEGFSDGTHIRFTEVIWLCKIPQIQRKAKDGGRGVAFHAGCETCEESEIKS